MAGAGGDQRDRVRLRPQPQRVQRGGAGLDAVHPVLVGHVRRRRQRRRQAGPLQPGRRDLRRRALPARGGRRQEHQPGDLRLQPRRLVRPVGAAARQGHRRNAGRPRRVPHRVDRGPLPGGGERHLRGRAQLAAGDDPGAVGERRRRRQRHVGPPLDRHLLARRRAGGRRQRRGDPSRGRKRGSAATSFCRTSTATPTRTRTSARSPRTYPAPRQQQPATPARATLETPPTDARPSTPASAGLQAASRSRRSRSGTPSRRVSRRRSRSGSSPTRPARRPTRRAATSSSLGQAGPVAGYGNHDNYVATCSGSAAQDVVLKAAAARSAGDRRHDPRRRRPDRPAGRAARDVRCQARRERRAGIDPKPILDGWKLLEATAIYRASGKNPFWGNDAQEPLDRPDPADEQGPARAAGAGRSPHPDLRLRAADIQTHVIDRRVLALLEFLAPPACAPTSRR